MASAPFRDAWPRGMAGILNQLHLCAADTCKKFWLAMHTAMHTDPDSWCSMVHMARNLQNMCLVIILLAACSGLGATVSTASSAPDFVFVPTSGPCLTNNGGQPTVPYYNDIVVSKAVSMDPEPGETHIPGHGPEVETIEACLAACLERNVHVVSVNFLQGRECMCSGGCPCFEPLGGGWLVALPANCQHQQPQVCQDSESHGGWEPRGNRSSCMGFFDKSGHPVDDAKMSHPWGKASFAHCHQPFSWRQMNKNMSKDVFKTGGLGTLMEMDGYETWVCLHSSIIRPHWNPRCPHTGLVATVDPWFCWVYHETREEFTPWGPNSRVKLFDPPPVKDPIRSPDGRFVLVDMPMTWEEARTYCRTHFADLVSIHSSLVNSIVASLCEKAASVNGAEHGDTGIACWIGGYRSMSSQGLDLWAWSDGSAFDFTSWSEGEPNNFGSSGEPYIHMWSDAARVGEWNDNGAGFQAGATVCSAAMDSTGSGYSYWDFDPVDGCVTESEMDARKALEDFVTQEWWPDFASLAGFADAWGAADTCDGISEADFKAFAAEHFSGGPDGECSLCADPTLNCKCSAEKGLSGVCGPAPFCYDAATTAIGGRTAQEQCAAASDVWCGSGSDAQMACIGGPCAAGTDCSCSALSRSDEACGYLATMGSDCLGCHNCPTSGWIMGTGHIGSSGTCTASCSSTDSEWTACGLPAPPAGSVTKTACAATNPSTTTASTTTTPSP